jgi:hypothetical protein
MAEVAAVEQVVFHRPKAGATEAEWEDCAGFDPGDPARGRPARYVIVDGATEAYDSIRWVRQLVTSFLGLDGDPPPPIAATGVDEWVGQMQQRWLDEAPRAFANVYEERKFLVDGSFATFLGCEILGLDGAPRFTAAALGDAVLFHVRGSRLVAQFPPLGPDDFGLTPDGVFTQPSQRDRMRAALRLSSGSLQVGDVLFFATDALAAWLVDVNRLDGEACWQALAAVEHPADFSRLVAQERNGHRMKNDDVTLLRVEIVPSEADVLVVCR